MKHKTIKAFTAAAILLLTSAVGLGGFYAYRLSLRPERQNERRSLFQGVTYERYVRDRPRPIVFHVITVDLTAPGVDFLVTPPAPTDEYPLAADTVPGFLAQNEVQVAINASYFAPHHVHSPLHYYPHVGDGTEAQGIAISNGDRYLEAKEGWAALCILSNSDIRITANDCPAGTQQGVAGDIQFVKDGQPYDGLAILKNSVELMPRSAIGINADNTKLWIVALDGRQSGYSEGVTLVELGEIMIELGVDRALNFDGGGSTTLAMSDPDGQAITLNAPIQARIPMNLRPVANHLGVYARPLSADNASSEVTPSEGEGNTE